MYEEEIEKVDEWFKNHGDFSTYNNDEEYVVDAVDVGDFCDFIREEFPDLIGIECMVNNGGIWFKRSDLESARSY